MEKIGQGAFTTVYRQGKKVFLRSDDHAKECMAHGWFPSSRFFPTIKISDKCGYDYEMKYYPKQSSLKKSLKPAHYELYKELRGIMTKASWDSDFYTWHKAFKTIKNRSLKTALREALDALGNYGTDVCFEISPRNVAVSETGCLILLDCFFFKSQLMEKRS